METLSICARISKLLRDEFSGFGSVGLQPPASACGHTRPLQVLSTAIQLQDPRSYQGFREQ